MKNRAKVIIGDSRKMIEIEDNSVQLVVTSPPYWSIKNYGVENQIGYGQTLHEYLKDLYRVWKEAYRVLEPGRRLVINIGDQFARAIIYGRYKIIPLHAEIISQCEDIGFDYMGSIVWQKKTTMNTTGGANVMGSYPYPPNGMVEIDYEHILIFKKQGKSKKVSKEVKEKSKLTKEEWKEYFYGHWYFGGAKQIDHEAMFPDELPRRLIKMFTFTGETVLDPFAGSGTTLKTAIELNRKAIGYEINEKFLDIIKKKIGMEGLFSNREDIEIMKREGEIVPEKIDYKPRIKDAKPIVEPEKLKFKKNEFYKVAEILSDGSLRLDTGIIVKFRGVVITDIEKTISYLKNYLLRKKVYLKFDKNYIANNNYVEAYVYLKNKIFVNKYLIESGLALADKSNNYDMRKKFINLKLSTEKRVKTKEIFNKREKMV